MLIRLSSRWQCEVTNNPAQQQEKDKRKSPLIPVKMQSKLLWYTTFQGLRNYSDVGVFGTAHPSVESFSAFAPAFLQDTLDWEQLCKNPIEFLLLSIYEIGAEIEIADLLLRWHWRCQLLIKTVDEVVVSHTVASQLNKIIEIRIVCHCFALALVPPPQGRSAKPRQNGRDQSRASSTVSSHRYQLRTIIE